MKKILPLIALLTLLIMPSTMALASTDNSTAIADTVTSHTNVKTAKVLVTDDMCIVAIQPLGIVARSDYDALVETLTNTIKEEYNIEHVHITRAVKAYRMIDKLSTMTEEEKTEAIDQLLQRVEHGHRPMPMPKLEPAN